jgi:hypothetical protein
MHIRNAVRTAVLSAAFAGFTTAANAQAVQFFAVLDGGNEVSAGGAAAAGDLNGNGVASVLISGNQLCFSLLVRGIANPTLAHIHSGLPGVSGPISIQLTPVPANGALGHSSGCVPAAPRVTNMIKLNPNAYYVNVHNGDFTAGAIRGQLF